MTPDGGSRDGPEVQVTHSCRGCRHLLSEYYSVEDGNDCDWGFNYACALVREPGKPAKLDPVKTPKWCPRWP